MQETPQLHISLQAQNDPQKFPSSFMHFSFCLPSLFHHLPSTQLSSKLGNKTSPNKPLHFLKILNGTRKGNIAKGLSQLKKYLANHTNPISCTHMNSDSFDHTLEQAIKEYQTFYKIKVSGILDPQTITSILTPRCGVADFITNHHANLASLGDYKYAISGKSWPPNKRHLTVSFSKRTRRDARAPVKYALNRWANVAHFQFTFTDKFDASDVKISFERRAHGDRSPFDGPGKVLAHSSYPPHGILHFDAEENWTTSVSKGQFDLQTVALHELGHILGLGHSGDPNAVMYAIIREGERKDLSSDDIDGIRSIYHN